MGPHHDPHYHELPNINASTPHTPLTNSTTSTNQQLFDHLAPRYDTDPRTTERAQKSALAMRKMYAFNEDTTQVLDYACGTGLISRELAPFAKSITGVDISQGMVDEYNRRVHNQGIPPQEMHAVCTRLQARPGELDGAQFDVAVCASAYHHMESIEETTSILAYFLKPGGTLLVVDLETSDQGPICNADGTHHQHQHHLVPHHDGFEKADIEHAFLHAGLTSFTYEIAFTARRDAHPVTLFVAKGTKPTAF
ncbi:hypothetical protein AMATHDRAFT_46336 [Amanita thiersii Skay4041]|uniref:Methyltransferase domain-containing protein n=1 Tax=Amanita thiersii Skay4041 TaxID=703135 RepID=A0A2A9NXE3_9AGAR|nr:hypothetical protein AMATHDRAFT_46336 [Amanita thiersii Skay4041]